MTASASVHKRLELPQVEFLRYLLSAIAALALDTGLFLLMLELGWTTAWSAALGFGAGLVLIYVLSTRYVFKHRRLRNRQLEFGAFSAIGLLGLAITELALHLLIHGLGVAPALSKLGTAGMVFMLNYLSRKVLLFKRAVQ